MSFRRPSDERGARSSPLEPLLEARSIAVVGASARRDSFGRHMLEELFAGGYSGEVFPVNPRYDELFGRRCYPSMAELPRPVDLAVLGIKNALLERELTAAVDAGAGAAVIFASCYDEPAHGAPSLVERLTHIAAEADMPVCGGNCMGFLNLAAGLRVCGFLMPEELAPGGISFISHSGSAFSAMAYNDRSLRFNLVVSAGQEFTTTAAHYLDYALRRPETKVVGMFLETVRRPELFRAALEEAALRDIPVVILKVGREARTKDLIAAHSGALAGSNGAYEALFRAYGVVRVRSLDEMADALELFVAGRRPGPGGLAAIHDSGGERAMLVDAAADAGVPLARVSESTRERLERVLEEGLPPVNPLDAWGTGNDFVPIYEECMHALLDDPDTAALAFSVDLTTQEVPETGYVRVAKEVFEHTTKPMAVLSNLSSAIDRRDVASLRASGVPVLEGTYDGLAAFKHLLGLRDARARPPLAHPAPAPAEGRERWRRRLAGGAPPAEAEGLELLGAYGIPTVAAATATTSAEALSVAQRIGWPVAVKTAAPGVQHKSDVRGVILDVASPEHLARAYADLSSRLGPAVTLAAMAPSGLELALGIVRDPQFGPLVMVSAGGILIEMLEDARWALPPLDEVRARELVDELQVRPLLNGSRGATALDVDAVVRTIVRLSVLADDLGEDLDALDVNPLIALPEGCVAVDALVIPRAR
ncbi:acetate--CoA ligase family protein [soil metagenome]